MIFLFLVIVVIIGLLYYKYKLRNEPLIETCFPFTEEPEITKTLEEWLAYWGIPKANVMNWDIDGYQLNKQYTKSDFVAWGRKSLSIKYYLKRLVPNR